MHTDLRLQLVDAILALPDVETEWRRNEIVADLEESIATAICSCAAPRAHIFHIVTACDQHPGGHNSLLRALQNRYEDNAELANIAEFFAATDESLSDVGPSSETSIPALIQAFRDEDEDLPWSAALAIGAIGPAAIPELIDALGDQEGRVRYWAVCALAIVGPDASEAVSALMRALEDEVILTRFLASYALSRIGPAAIPPLLQAFRSQSQPKDTRLLAIRSLGLIRTITSDVITTLVEALEDEDGEVRSFAISALGHIATVAPNIIRKVLWALEDEDDKVRSAAAYALGHIGPAIPEVIPALIVALSDQSGIVSNSVAIALSRIGSAAIPGLLRAIEDQTQSDDARSSAAKALGWIGPAGPEVIPALIQALADKDARVRAAAAAALGEIGPAAVEAVPALIQTLQDRDVSVIVDAATALGKIGPASPEVVPALVKALTDGHTDMHSAVVYALSEIGPEAADAVPALVYSLGDRCYFAATKLPLPLIISWAVARKHLPSFDKLLTSGQR